MLALAELEEVDPCCHCDDKVQWGAKKKKHKRDSTARLHLNAALISYETDSFRSECTMKYARKGSRGFLPLRGVRYRS